MGIRNTMDFIWNHLVVETVPHHLGVPIFSLLLVLVVLLCLMEEILFLLECDGIRSHDDRAVSAAGGRQVLHQERLQTQCQGMGGRALRRCVSLHLDHVICWVWSCDFLCVIR